MSLITVLSLPPRQRDVPHQIVWRHILLPSSDTRKLGLWGLFFLSGPTYGFHLCLRPGDSLTILKMALSVSFIRLVFLHET